MAAEDRAPDAGEPSDAELITRVRGGDRAAFGSLYERHSAAATNLARHYARSAAEIDDLVSEAFARMLDLLLDGRGPDTAFRAYLFTTLRHTAFDRTRKDSKLRLTDDMTTVEEVEELPDPVLAGAEAGLVGRAFAALPERWQTVLWHTEVERETPQQVAVLLGITPNAVTSLAFRAREGLRQAYLQAHLADTAAERCRTTVGRLGAWVRGGLSKRETAEVETHLDECDRCQALAAELAEMNTSLRAVLAPLLLGGAATAYLAGGPAAHAAEAGAVVTAGAGAQTAWWTSWPLLAAGSAALAAAVVSGIVIFGGGPTGDESAAPVAVPVPTSTSSQVAPSPGDSPSSVTPAAPALADRPSTEVTLPEVSTAGVDEPTAPIDDSTPVIAPTPAVSTTPQITTHAAPKPTSTTKPVKTTTSSPPAATQSTPSSTSAAPTPAELSAPQLASNVSEGTAGGTATIGFSITNSGGSDSSPQQVTVTTPAGMTVAAVSAAASPAALRHSPGALRNPAALAAPRAADPALSCSGGSCELIVPGATTVTITVTVDIDPAAGDGTLTITTPSGSATASISVNPALFSIHLGDLATVFPVGGSIKSAPITAAVRSDVTRLPSIVLPIRAGELTLTPASPTCSQTRTTITCSAINHSGQAASYGAVTITIGPNAQGPQPFQAQAGAGSVPVLAADGNPITVVWVAPDKPTG